MQSVVRTANAARTLSGRVTLRPDRHTHRSNGFLVRDSAPKFKALYEELLVAGQEERTLPNEALQDLIYMIKDRQQAQQYSALVVDDIKKRLQRPNRDWSFRKKLYTAFALRAIQVGGIAVVLSLLQDPESAILEKYFIADLIWELATEDVDTAVLVQLLEIQRANTPRSDPAALKGLRRAYWELLKCCDVRNQQDRMSALYLQAKADGVSFTDAFTQKLEQLAAVAPTS
jgi:hypothetical protein